ncbi:hypothetical protein CRYUN_Cryun01aG0248800 [Craigia yunnanensis]
MYSAMENNLCSSGSSSNSEIVRYKRDIPPAHYSFKIESSSLLLNTRVEKIESGFFEAGGYKWWPLKKQNLCLTVGKSMLNSNYLYLIRKKAINYLTVQGFRNGGIKRFHKMKTECGFAKLIPLKTLKDRRNYGFLSIDSCVFGAEVFVIKQRGYYECLSMVKEPDRVTFTWELDIFSTVDETTHFSKAFTVGGRKWKIKVYPQDKGKAKGDWFSVFLVLSDSDTLPPKGKVYAEYKLRVLDQRRDRHVEKTGKHWFTASDNSWGNRDMIRLGDLHEKSKGFIMNDTLIVDAQIVVISVTKFLH